MWDRFFGWGLNPLDGFLGTPKEESKKRDTLGKFLPKEEPKLEPQSEPKPETKEQIK
jgi:hypothetical protein